MVILKKMIDEIQIYKDHYEEIYEQVKNDPFAKSLGIQLTKFRAGFAEAEITVKSNMVQCTGQLSML